MASVGGSGRPRVLIVDDDPDVGNGMSRYFQAHGLASHVAGSCAAGEAAFHAQRADVVIVDHVLPDGDSLALLAIVRKRDPLVPVVVMTGYGTVDLAVRALRMGAHDVLTKPLPMSVVLAAVRAALAARPETLPARDAIDCIGGESASIEALRRNVAAIASADCPVLLLGETGSGKGVVARAIHESGARARGPFVDLNCSVLSKELAESELFGHTRGAFTGAHAVKSGLFEVADSGTLFLDEIGDIDPAVQPKLLKAIEDRRFRRLGEVRDRSSNVRLLAATHLPLASCSNAVFRRDLFYRISTMTIEVPPLRARGGDVVLLARQFLHAATSPSRGSLRLSDGAERKLLEHAWPGNVRELRNVIDRAVFFARGAAVSADDIRLDRSEHAAEHDANTEAKGRVRRSQSSLTLEEVARSHIELVLAEENGDMARAAKRLGIARSTLYQKTKLFSLKRTGDVD